MKDFKNKEKLNTNNNEFLFNITKELHEIIEYIEINIINIQNNNEKEKQNKKKINLGVKRKNSIKLNNNEINKNNDEINLNENEEKNENSKKNKKFKEIINRLKRHSIEIIKKVNDILTKIYDYKNIRDELNINHIRIRKSLFGYRDSKRILYYKDGDRYEGDVKNNIREGKGIFYIMMVIYMKEIIKIIKKKEKEYIIVIMVIYMNEIIKIIKKKEKEYIIIIMVIYMKVI